MDADETEGGRRMPNDTGVGRRAVGTAGIAVTASVLVFSCVLLIYSVIEFWPPTQTTPAAGQTVSTVLAESQVSYFGAHFTVSQDDRLFVVVAMFGFLGGLIHALRSLYWYVGNRTLMRSWLLFYVIVPFVGAALGLLIYVVLRGGLISPQASSADVSPFGFAAVAGLVGLFTQQAAQKLLDVFEVVLTPAQKGREHTPPRDVADQVALGGFRPTSGPPGTEVTIAGQGLADVSEVTFGEAEAAVQMRRGDEIQATVPPGAATGPIRVRIGTRILESSEHFTVTEQGP